MTKDQRLRSGPWPDGITGSTPPSNQIKEVLAKDHEARTGFEAEIETTLRNQIHDRAIRDMVAGTGVDDMVSIVQDIICAYPSRNFMTSITQPLNGSPALKAPAHDDGNFTTFGQPHQGRRWRSVRRSGESLPETLLVPFSWPRGVPGPPQNFDHRRLIAPFPLPI